MCCHVSAGRPRSLQLLTASFSSRAPSAQELGRVVATELAFAAKRDGA